LKCSYEDNLSGFFTYQLELLTKARHAHAEYFSYLEEERRKNERKILKEQEQENTRKLEEALKKMKDEV